METKVVKNPIKREELLVIAEGGFGDFVKAAVDLEQKIMVVGGELHADEEVVLTEQCGSKRENIWGVNIYPKKADTEWIEFDSMINIKPHHGNRSRGVEDASIREIIKHVVRTLISG